MSNTDSLYDNIVLDNHVESKREFDDILKGKILSLIDQQKQEIASSLFQEKEVVDDVAEAVNVLNIMKQLSDGKQTTSMNLQNGSYVDIDPKTGEILADYINTLKNEDKQIFIKGLLTNERTFFKHLDIASKR